MDLDKMMQNVPEPWRAVVAKYGPALAEMSSEQLLAWVELLILGRDAEAYALLLNRLDDAALAEEWRRLDEQWAKANADNAERGRLGREAVLVVLEVLLKAAGASVLF